MHECTTAKLLNVYARRVILAVEGHKIPGATGSFGGFQSLSL